jgi:hypothetical protein
MLIRIARLLAMLLVTLIVVWALVLGWWQANDHSPSPTESLLYLVALPLALVGGFMLLTGFIDGLRQPPAPVATASTSAPDTGAPLEVTDAAERRHRAHLLASAMAVPAGSDAAALIAAAQAGAAPKPDAELKDADGFPAFTARVATVDVDAFRESLDALEAAAHWPEARMRSLALVDAALCDLLPALKEQLEARPCPGITLRLDWLLDGELPDSLRQALSRWITDTHLHALEPLAVTLALHPLADEAAALQLTDARIQAMAKAVEPCVSIILAGSSNLDATRIARWQADGRLFTPQRQQGQIPGEGAAALALVTPETGDHLALDAPISLSRLSLGQRDKSADAGGRITPALCNHLADGLLQALETPAATVAALVSDSDHRASRQAEALGMLDERFETLDPARDYLAVGTIGGSATPVGALIGLLCAAEQAREKQAPVLALSVQHPTMRAVALLMPPPAPEESTT